MWMFHFRVGGERQTGSRIAAQGIGHAMRCIALIEKVRQTTVVTSCIVTSDNEEARTLLTNRGLDFYPESMLEDVLSSGACKMVISDINYLEEDVFRTYRSYRPCTCLAPRGQGKYFADLAFKDVMFNDEDPLSGGPIGKVFSGPRYVVTGMGFNRTRLLLEKGEILKHPRTVVISMGGMDHFDMTSAAIRGLIGLPQDWTVRVITGPLYAYSQKLPRLIRELSCDVQILNDPEDIMQILAASSIGVFGTGLVSYEAVGLGTPCLNLTQTPFHEKRSRELEGFGVGLHLGDASHIFRGQIADLVLKLWNESPWMDQMRKTGMELVDGKGAQRIVNGIEDYLLKSLQHQEIRISHRRNKHDITFC